MAKIIRYISGCSFPVFMFIIPVFLIITAGCGESSSSSNADTSKKEAVTNKSSSATEKIKHSSRFLVRVGTNELNVVDVENEQRLRCSLERIRRSKVTEKNLEKIRKRISETAVKYFVTSSLLSEYFKENKLSINPAERRKYESQIARSHKVKNITVLKTQLPGDLVNLFEKGIERSLIIKEAKSHIVNVSAKNVTDKEVDDAIARYQRANHVASMTNKLVYAQASNVWNKVISKVITFNEAAYDYSQIDDEASAFGMWGTFKLDQFPTEEEKSFREWLSKSSEGNISPPLIADNGLCIVRLNSTQASTENEGEKEYNLSRIFFKLPVMWEIPSKKEMKKIISGASENKAIESALSEVAKRHKVIYSK